MVIVMKTFMYNYLEEIYDYDYESMTIKLWMS